MHNGNRPLFFLVAMLTCTSSALAQDDAVKQYPTGYFYRKTLNTPPEVFHVITDASNFKDLFGSMITKLDKSPRIEPADFEKRMAIAVVKNDFGGWTFNLDKVSRDGNTLTVHYKAQPPKKKESLKSIRQLLISVPREGIAKIAFSDNGKVVKTIEIDN